MSDNLMTENTQRSPFTCDYCEESENLEVEHWYGSGGEIYSIHLCPDHHFEYTREKE